MTTAATKPVTVEYVTYDGTNLDEVTTFAGGISAAIGPGNVPQIMTSDGRYADLHPGWVVSTDGDGAVTVHSAEAWARFFQPA
jgi:hypothetical protein